MMSSLTLATISSTTSARAALTNRARTTISHPCLRMPGILRSRRVVRDVAEGECLAVQDDRGPRAEILEEALGRGLRPLEGDLAPHPLAPARLRGTGVVDRLEQKEEHTRLER